MPQPCLYVPDVDFSALAAISRRRCSLPAPAAARELRERAQLSQGELAGEIGVEPSTISRWESGSRKPRGKRADAYAGALVAVAEAIEG